MATIAEKLEAFDEKMDFMDAAFRKAEKLLQEEAEKHTKQAEKYQDFGLVLSEQNAAIALHDATMILIRTRQAIRRENTHKILEEVRKETTETIKENSKFIEESSKDLNERLDALMQKQH